MNLIKIIKSLFDNISIEELIISGEEINSLRRHLTKLITSNKTIKVLNLVNCKLKITLKFVEALAQNKSLEFLQLDGNIIKNNCVTALKECNLKKISLERTNLSRHVILQIEENLKKNTVIKAKEEQKENC